MKSVTLDWVLNNLINHVSSRTDIFESDGRAGNEKYICTTWDPYYEEHKKELWNRIVYFINIPTHGNGQIYIRPINWKK